MDKPYTTQIVPVINSVYVDTTKQNYNKTPIPSPTLSIISTQEGAISHQRILNNERAFPSHYTIIRIPRKWWCGRIITRKRSRSLGEQENVDERELNNCTDDYASVKLKTKRFALPLVGLLGLLWFEESQTFIYFPILIGFVSLIVFWNFPMLVCISNSRPIYYEDLYIDTEKFPVIHITPEQRKRFENTFHWSLITMNTLLVAGLSDYWLYKTTDNMSYFNIIGVTGGIIKIFQIVNCGCGSLILVLTHRKIRNTNTDDNTNINNDN